jgi:hypothetical protein
MDMYTSLCWSRPINSYCEMHFTNVFPLTTSSTPHLSYILLPFQPSFTPSRSSPLQTLTIIPLGQLHRPMIIQMLVHIKAIPQQMRLMSPPLPQTLKLGFIEIIL